MRTAADAADRPYTYILCAFKCYLDIQSTSSILGPLLDHLSTDTSIVLLQNGIGIEDELLDTLRERGLTNPVISGCAWVDSTMVDGGRAVRQHGNERLVLGYHTPRGSDVKAQFDESKAQAALNALCTLLRTGGANIESANIDAARWRKVLWYVYFHLHLEAL